MLEHRRSPRCDFVGLSGRGAEHPAQHVDVVDRVLEQRPAARLVHVGAPCRRVEALDREVLVVPEDGREGSAVLALGDEVGRGPEHRRVPQHEADLVRDVSKDTGKALGVRQCRREGLLAEDGAGSPPRRAHRLEVRRRPRAHPHDVDLGDQLGKLLAGTRVVMTGDAGGAFVVRVERSHHARVDKACVAELT